MLIRALYPYRIRTSEADGVSGQQAAYREAVAASSTPDAARGRRRLDDELAGGVADALALIRERFEGKARRSRERAFLAVHEHAVAALAQGRAWAAAERRHLADHACLHVRTFDAAVRDLEELGVLERVPRRIRYDFNLPNLWRSRPVAQLAGPREPSGGPSKPHPGTTTLPHDLETRTAYTEASPRSRARAPRFGKGQEFRWPEGPAEHPVLHALPWETRIDVAEAYETIRERLLAAGVARVPEGGWLAAIRDFSVDDGGSRLLDRLDAALDDFLAWRDEGGPLCRSFAWMHKYRRSACPPPSLLFGLEPGDHDDKSGGEDAFSFWLNERRSW